ncbi:hypothetical protein K431DRAFT_275973 [Polychaeton citri CBS 116435]|uniref:MARVEL domain-containing protein n=1 Tax=Polychaeton citri CBS 116435 TaxID=1314669 RepID=A0A9P4Q4E3_9PEZI|nr:hypothetical protein K431DRAFT_275973 [Polychaeton citri CBS 116435]
MALSGFLFICWRIFEIITLVPIVGMLGWFVSRYDNANLITPTYILVLFIVSVLALAWAFFTLIQYYRAKHDAAFVGIVDLLFMGALIGGVVELRGITGANCSNTSSNDYYGSAGGFTLYGPGINVNKECAMLKASFALGIVDIIAFFITCILAFLVHRRHRDDDRVIVKREYHTSRHGHRSRSRDHRGSRDYGSRPPRTGSRSHYSSRRSNTYV